MWGPQTVCLLLHKPHYPIDVEHRRFMDELPITMVIFHIYGHLPQGNFSYKYHKP